MGSVSCPLATFKCLWNGFFFFFNPRKRVAGGEMLEILTTLEGPLSSGRTKKMEIKNNNLLRRECRTVLVYSSSGSEL